MLFKNFKSTIVKRCLDNAINKIQCAKSKTEANQFYGKVYGILDLAHELGIYSYLSCTAIDYCSQANKTLTNRIGFLECSHYEKKQLDRMEG